MIKLNRITILLLFIVVTMFTACSASRKSNCGCNVSKGMVGY